ncbi:3D domain-containing protein [Amphibacillus cookii]|uniref:3D domain-containing protein n=1 Tax=Amphibacillus cookii TaxID=767787 RepID=UPI001957BC9B|nr:3D domain-containing protein [Amphibacillus cookii]MBM7540900.1 3D (Asp-Asp-Asp) domain-containing protein/LysM repeat protein [Amphibacillus cookii]
MKKMVLSLLTVTVVSTAISASLHAQEYEVESGDSLWKIASVHDTSIDTLRTLNELDSDIIHPGQVLQIEEEEIYHQVERGDTLYDLAGEYEVTVLDLMNWNDLNSDLIIVGQELVIYPNAEAVDQVVEETPAQPASAPEETEEVAASESDDNQSQTEESSEQKTISMTATAYTAECDGCTGITATGLNLNEDRNKKVIAVDPSVIPLGTRVHVEGYGEAVAGDTGGAIQGNKIDIHVPTREEALSWGVREVDVTILE